MDVCKALEKRVRSGDGLGRAFVEDKFFEEGTVEWFDTTCMVIVY